MSTLQSKINNEMARDMHVIKKRYSIKGREREGAYRAFTLCVLWDTNARKLCVQQLNTKMRERKWNGGGKCDACPNLQIIIFS
jgi:hypothetical protein